MCTNFERSALRVIQVFADPENEALTVDQLYALLGPDAFDLHLGGGTSLEVFVRALRFEGLLAQIDSKSYRITTRGRYELRKLQEVVSAA